MLNGSRVCAVIVAAGSSSRMGFDKLFAPLAEGTVLQQSVRAFEEHPMVDHIVVVASAANRERVQALFAHRLGRITVVLGGSRRQDSVRNGIVAAGQAGWIAIHDGARPYVQESTITAALLGALETGCAAPAVPVKDTVKVATADGTVQTTPDRSTLFAVQTPQVVEREKYLAALDFLGEADVTDDCSVMERAGFSVRLTRGDYANSKITTPEDLPGGAASAARGSCAQPPVFRVGHGYDVHRLVEGRALILGGVNIPYEKGLLGHSDADVLLHAVMDALLGAATMGDIGKYFPDSDVKWKGADSAALLRAVYEKLRAAGWRVENVDATVLCQKPKLAAYIPQMRAVIAQKLEIALEQVSVKATTEEGLGFTGAGEGIAAHCVAMLCRG